MRVGIWEQDEGLYEAIMRGTRHLPQPPEFLRGSHPAQLSHEVLDLLVVSPAATGLGGTAAITCRVALLPGMAARSVSLRAESAVSYGLSPKDTLTLSSLEGERICIALQRELVTVFGEVIERQELVLPYPDKTETPQHFMAQVGALLLLGCSP